MDHSKHTTNESSRTGKELLVQIFATTDELRGNRRHERTGIRMKFSRNRRFHTRNLRKPAYDYSSDKAHRGQHKTSITQYRTITLNTSNVQSLCWNFNAFQDEVPWCWVANQKYWDNTTRPSQTVLGLFSDRTGPQRFHDEEKKIMADWYWYCLTNVHKKSYNPTITQLKPTAGIDYLHNIDSKAHNQLALMVWKDKDYLTGKFKPVNPQFAPASTVKEDETYPHTIWTKAMDGYKLTQPQTFSKHYEPQLMYGAKLTNVELADMPGVKTRCIERSMVIQLA